MPIRLGADSVPQAGYVVHGSARQQRPRAVRSSRASWTSWRASRSGGLYGVEGGNVRHLPMEGALAGEAHYQKGEAVAIHEEGRVSLTVLGVNVGGLVKIDAPLVDQVTHRFDDVGMIFPEVGRHVAAVGVYAVALGDEGGDGPLGRQLDISTNALIL